MRDDRCRLPPPGWRCTRKPGHTGPCAAIRDTRWRRLLARLKRPIPVPTWLAWLFIVSVIVRWPTDGVRGLRLLVGDVVGLLTWLAGWLP